MPDLLKKSFFDDVRKKNLPKAGKIFAVCSGPASQSIGRGRLNREGALASSMFAKVENGVTPNFSPEKQEKRNFGLVVFLF